MAYRRGPPESPALLERVLREARDEFRRHAGHNLETFSIHPSTVRPVYLREISLHGDGDGNYRPVERMRGVDMVMTDPHRGGDVHDIHTHSNRSLSALASEHDLLSLLFLAEREPDARMSIHVLDHAGAEVGLNDALQRELENIMGSDQEARDRALWRINQQVPDFADRLRHAGIVHVRPGRAFLEKINRPKELDPVFADLIARRRITDGFNDIVDRVGWPKDPHLLSSWTGRAEPFNIRPREKEVIHDVLTRPNHAEFLDWLGRKHGEIFVPEIEEVDPFKHDPVRHMFTERVKSPTRAAVS